MRRAGHDAVGQGAAFHVRAGEGDRQGGILGGGHRLGIGKRGIVHGEDGDRNGGGG